MDILSLEKLLDAVGLLGLTTKANSILNTSSAVVTLVSACSSTIHEIEDKTTVDNIMPQIEYASLSDELVPIYEQIEKQCQAQKNLFTGQFSFSDAQKEEMTKTVLNQYPGFRANYDKIKVLFDDFYIRLESAINQRMSFDTGVRPL